MSLPENRIKKITVPKGSSTETYDIVPEMLGKNGYSAELPALTGNSTIALTKDLMKSFSFAASDFVAPEDYQDFPMQLDSETAYAYFFSLAGLSTADEYYKLIGLKTITAAQFQEIYDASVFKLSVESAPTFGAETDDKEMYLWKAELATTENASNPEANFIGQNYRITAIKVSDELYILGYMSVEVHKLHSFAFTATEIVSPSSSEMTEIADMLSSLEFGRSVQHGNVYKKQLNEVSVGQLGINVVTYALNATAIRLDFPNTETTIPTGFKVVVYPQLAGMGFVPCFIGSHAIAWVTFGNEMNLYAAPLTEVTATTTKAGYMSAADKTKLDGIAAGAEVNVQSDWNASSGDALILNKPTLGTAAACNIGTASGNVPVLNSNGKLDISIYDNTTYVLNSSSSTSTGAVKYLEAASFENGVLTLETKYLKLQ